MSKKSIRFFNDREVRAVWDEEHSKWWFSATDIVRAINDEDDYAMVKKEAQYRRNSTRECHSRLQIPSSRGLSNVIQQEDEV